MMKRFKIALIAAVVIAAVAAGPAVARQPAKPAAVAAPRVTSAVLDSAKALDAAQLQDLKSVVTLNELRTGMQIVIVIAPTLAGGTADSYTADVKDAINFAQQGKPAVLFVVAVKEKAATISAGPGTGLSAKAQQAIIQRIVLPNFRLGKINTGIYDGARAITLALQVPAITQAAQVETEQGGGFSGWLPLIVLGVFLVGFGNSDWSSGGYYGNNTSYNGRGYGGGSRRY